MTKRLSPGTHQVVYDLLVQRDGEICTYCGCKACVSKQMNGKGEQIRIKHRLDIDHLDNDRSNWQVENLQLLCRSCNVRKQREKERVEKVKEWTSDSLYSPRVCAHPSVYKRGLDGCSATAEVRRQINLDDAGPIMQLNAIMELRFREWILEELSENLILIKTEAIYGGSEAAGCSPETARRYMHKLTSRMGPLQQYKNKYGRLVVVLKSQTIPEDLEVAEDE